MCADLNEGLEVIMLNPISQMHHKSLTLPASVTF